MKNRDKETLRVLASHWMELASQPIMAQRKRQWTALKDLHAERPRVLFETATLENYVDDAELACDDPLLRTVEKYMYWTIRHAEEVGDDIVVEPFFRIYWDINGTDYGVPMHSEHAIDSQGGDIAYTFEHSIKTPADIEKLKPRTWCVDRAKTCRRHALLNDLFGDILPVELHGTGSLFIGMTQDLFKLIGNDNLLTWTYDEPEALHRIMAYLRDDRLAYYTWLEREGLLGFNHVGWELVGSGSPGYTTALPYASDHPDARRVEGRPAHHDHPELVEGHPDARRVEGRPRLRDVWVWLESQETAMLSPRMFGQFFLPYMADVCRCFGLVYYGCCEPVHDRWDLIRTSIPNVRTVSISPWSNQVAMAEKLGRNYVYSRKPKPWPISGATPDWDALQSDLDETLAAARDCNLEIIYRDVYRIGDRGRLRTWTDLVRSRIS